MSKNYQRKYLRAPFQQEVLFLDDGFTFKTQGINISEGGILLESAGHFPEKEKIQLMTLLSEFPLFKNFSLEKLKKYHEEAFPGRVIRFEGEMTRKFSSKMSTDDKLLTNIGFEISKIKPFAQSKLAKYVETMSSNLIYLLVLFDTLNDDPTNIQKLRLISQHLGYPVNEKISRLRLLVEHDYTSLKW